MVFDWSLGCMGNCELKHILKRSLFVSEEDVPKFDSSDLVYLTQILDDRIAKQEIVQPKQSHEMTIGPLGIPIDVDWRLLNRIALAFRRRFHSKRPFHVITLKKRIPVSPCGIYDEIFRFSDQFVRKEELAIVGSDAFALGNNSLELIKSRRIILYEEIISKLIFNINT